MKGSIFFAVISTAGLATVSFAGSATWKLHPTSGFWTTAANWMPDTVPNGPADIATFDASATTDINLGNAEVDSIVFNSGASSYTLTMPSLGFSSLTMSGHGVINNSEAVQTFVSVDGNALNFRNDASAGDLTVFFNPATDEQSQNGGRTIFFDNSNAGSATFINGGEEGAAGGETQFFGSSSAGNAMIINLGTSPGDLIGGTTHFFESSSAGTATIINEGGTVPGGGASFTKFSSDASAADATVINHGGSVEGAYGGHTAFILGASPGNGTFIAYGTFSGYGAGRIYFDDSVEASPRIMLFGTGSLDLSTRFLHPDLTIGSLEGDGLVFLGAKQLRVGSNDSSTRFSGVIQDGGVVGEVGGSLTKIGSASLVLSGANIYTGGTTIVGGKLVVNNRTGSGTGPGAVQVKAGRLAGRGTIGGDVVVGTGSGGGAVLAPGQHKGRQNTLIIQGYLSFNSDSAYECGINSESAKADKVLANGVTLHARRFVLRDRGGASITPGTVLMVIDNTSANSISGTFANLPDGGTVAIGDNTYQVSYFGGDGNDLTLTVVP